MQRKFFSLSENDRKSFIENPINLFASKSFYDAIEFYGRTLLSEMFVEYDEQKIPLAFTVIKVDVDHIRPQVNTVEVLTFITTLTIPQKIQVEAVEA